MVSGWAQPSADQRIVPGTSGSAQQPAVPVFPPLLLGSGLTQSPAPNEAEDVPLGATARSSCNDSFVADVANRSVHVTESRAWKRHMAVMEQVLQAQCHEHMAEAQSYTRATVSTFENAAEQDMHNFEMYHERMKYEMQT